MCVCVCAAAQFFSFWRTELRKEIFKLGELARQQARVIEGLESRAGEAQREMDAKNEEVSKVLQESVTWENDLLTLESDHAAVMMAGG